MDCRFHGFSSLNCPMCKAERVASDADALRSGRAVIGVFAWTGRNDYSIEKALKTYKTRAAADKYADKLNQDPLRICAAGYVARLVYV
ncbi:MAG: hypothetical protein ACAH17_01535 [Candidatus Paceibacterota bacterium]